MPWITLPGVEGLVYEPDASPRSRKRHNCKDCYSCQMCSETRCKVCLKRKKSKPCRKKKRQSR